MACLTKKRRICLSGYCLFPKLLKFCSIQYLTPPDLNRFLYSEMCY